MQETLSSQPSALSPRWVVWICSCGQLETEDGRAAFAHRSKDEAETHHVVPILAGELQRDGSRL